MHFEQLWNLNQLLEHYPGLSYHGVRWLIRNRRIPIIKIGKRIYFDPQEVEIWKNSQKIEPIERKKI